MKLTHTKTLLTTLSTTAALMLGSSLEAATLTDVSVTGLAADADVSVSPGFEGYSLAGAGSLTAFNGAVYDYAFHDTNTDGAAPTYVGPQGLISGLNDVDGTDDKINLWISGDPGTDAPTNGASGVRWAANATFTVDISGLSSGSIYVFNGSWQARTDWMELSMTGTGQPEVNSHSGGDTVFGFAPAEGGRLMNAKRIDFADAADYDTITFTLKESGSSSAYWGGVVITNATLVPEPGSLGLMGLGGLCMMRRRRD